MSDDVATNTSSNRGLPTWAAVLVVFVFILPVTGALVYLLFTTQGGWSYWVVFAPMDILLIYALLTGKFGSRRSDRTS